MSTNCFREISSSGPDNMSDDTKLNKTRTQRGSLETDAVVFNDERLSCKLKQVKIDSSHSTDVDDQQIQPSEAQLEENHPGTKTPGSPAGGAVGGSANAETTHKESHKESLPPTTKPKVTDDATSRALQQDQVPRTPSPIQETAAQPPLKPIAQKPPEEDDEHYDILLLYSEHDHSVAKQFLGVAKKANWKVATSNDFLPNRTKIKSFEDVYQNSSYTALLLTSKFFADVWCDSRYQGALTRAIEDPKKKDTVIPIICQDQGLEMPVMLSSLNGVNQSSTLFADRLKKCIKVEKRLEREKAEREKQT
ncbi:uncharacterized protein LOC117300608 [Asterias rubens]|uniref:uncharacterized protein LOC117300608 n=1 Tax=Asterias rubens TaxID=7604 RepID=UPI0014553391|nr:uncharacterized protein LOC117300608 [Asterias rubens]